MRSVLFASALAVVAAVGMTATPPAAPAGVTVKPGTGVVGLNWPDVAGAVSYRVTRAASAAGPFVEIGAPVRSRFLDTTATAGSLWHYRVTALNAAAEESEPAAGSAQPDASGIDRAAVRGSYRIGSSYVVDDFRLKQAYVARGYVVPTYRRQIIGAGVEYIWTDTLTNRPAEHEGHVAVLQDPGYDVLVMNAQRPWEIGNRELEGVRLWGEEALAANPDYRVFIHEYWTVENGGGGTWWDETNSQPREMLRLHRLSAARLARMASVRLGVPVYIAPFGTVVEAAKEAAADGLFEAYNSRDALHPDGSHLSDFGKYLQELVVFSGAYQQDPRGLPRALNSTQSLSTADAALAQQLIHDAVRGTPFSGWSTGAPATLQEHVAALLAAERNWQDFTEFTTGGAAGSFTDRHGLTWTFTKMHPAGSGIDRTAELEAGGRVSVTLPSGLMNLWLRFKSFAGTGGQVTVRANGQVVGVVTNDSTILWGRRLANLELGGVVELEIENTSGSRIAMDDVIWEDIGTGTGGLQILTQALGTAVLGQPYVRVLKATGGSGAFSWAVVDGQLPAGLTLAPEGLLQGAPTVAGMAAFRVRVTDTADPERSGEKAYEFSVANPTAIVSPPSGGSFAFGAEVRLSVVATGDQLRYRWLLDGVAQPASNTPEYVLPAFGPLNVGSWVVEVTGAGGTVQSAPVLLTLAGGGAQVLATSLTGTVNGEAGVTFDLQNTGTTPLELTGRFTGNFNAVSGIRVTLYSRVGTAAGHATNPAGWVLWGVTEPFSGNGYGIPTAFTLPTRLTIPPGETRGFTLIASAASKPLAYKSSSQTYQVGPLLFAPGQGLGSGPAHFALATFGPPRAFSGSIEFAVDNTPSVATVTLPEGTVGVPYAAILQANSGDAPLAWSVTGDLLPPGVVLNPATGALSGTPTSANLYPFMARVTDADGDTADRGLTIVIRDPLAEWIAGAGLPPGTSAATDPWGEGIALYLRHALGLPAGPGGAALLPSAGRNGSGVTYTLTRDLAASGHVVDVETTRDFLTWTRVYRSAPDGEEVTGVTIASRDVPPGETVETLVLALSEPAPVYARTVVREWPLVP